MRSESKERLICTCSFRFLSVRLTFHPRGRDQPLLHYYAKVFLPAYGRLDRQYRPASIDYDITPTDSDTDLSEATIGFGNSIVVNGLDMSFRRYLPLYINEEQCDPICFHRTIRVPGLPVFLTFCHRSGSQARSDNQKTHALPPDMGSFQVFNVAEYADRLPKEIVSKGGLFIVRVASGNAAPMQSWIFTIGGCSRRVTRLS